MGSEEQDRRFEAAAASAKHAKETADFLSSLTKNDTLVKPIYNPEAWVIRSKYRGAAERADLERTQCRHPLHLLQQFIDEEPSRPRDGNPVNLFVCGVCEMPLWLVDPWGEAVSDD